MWGEWTFVRPQLLQSAVTVTCVLELGSVFLHFILRATICDCHHHLGNIPPHPVLHREGLLIGVLKCHPCDRRDVSEEQTVEKEDKQEVGEKRGSK